MHAACVGQLAESLTYQIPDSESRVNFGDDMEKHELEFLPDDAPEEIVEALIEGITRMVKNYVGDADPSINLAFYWDVAGKDDTELADIKILARYATIPAISALVSQPRDQVAKPVNDDPLVVSAPELSYYYINRQWP